MSKSEKSSKRVLFVLENYYPHVGGVEVLFKALAEGLAADGYGVTVITTRYKGFKARETVSGVNIIRIKTLFDSRILSSFFMIPKALQLAGKSDIIHTTTYNASLSAYISSRITGKPCVITVHEVLGKRWHSVGGFSFLQALLLNFIENNIVRLNFDRLIGVSDATRNDILRTRGKRDKNRVGRVYNFLEEEHFNPKKHESASDALRKKFGLEKKYIVFSYGRPGNTKGHKYLVRAFPKIKEKIPNAILFFVMPKRPPAGFKMMLEEIEKAGITDDVIIVPEAPWSELPGYIGMSDVVVIPSLTEGFGFTVAESCLMQKKVVASNAGSIPEVIFGKYLLSEPANSESIADCVICMKDNNYDTLPKKVFSKRDMIDNYEKIYNDIFKERSLKKREA